jgi:hypothetical protein
MVFLDCLEATPGIQDRTHHGAPGVRRRGEVVGRVVDHPVGTQRRDEFHDRAWRAGPPRFPRRRTPLTSTVAPGARTTWFRKLKAVNPPKTSVTASSDEEVVVAEPPAAVVERDQEQIRAVRSGVAVAASGGPAPVHTASWTTRSRTAAPLTVTV